MRFVHRSFEADLHFTQRDARALAYLPASKGRQVPKKNVYVNDRLIGEARTWREVYALLKNQGLLFVGRAGVAEGPSGFYLSGSLAGRSSIGPAKQRANLTPVN